MLRKITNTSKAVNFTRQLSLSPFPSPSYPTQTSTLLKTLISNGYLNKALLEMALRGPKMKFKEYDTILNVCVSKRALREGQRVHSHMIITHYHPPVYLRTRLIVFYVKCGSLSEARKMFDEMPERNVVSWTAMISGYSQSGYASEALNLFVQMLRSGTEPNEFTFATVLTSCTSHLAIDLGKQIHSLILKNNFEQHIFVGSSLLNLYAKSGQIHEARIIFEELPERDVVSCTSIISGYAQLGFDEEALELFRRLKKEKMICNYVTYVSLLTSLSGLAALDHGKQVHCHVIRSQLTYIVLQNSIIDMYSKCGDLAYSRRVFNNMLEKTVISWNAMLVGYSKHGKGREVVQLFELMRNENKIKPDGITILAVLSGCSHGDMEDRGLRFFDELVCGRYGIDPEMEHYGCVVDLLGRSGKINKAFECIKKMPFEPTAAIWGSLLGACRVHLNVDVGVFVGKKLIEIEPENAGNYVILSNLFASAGRWEEMRIVRERMSEKAVIKEPGRSWLELNQTLHSFHAGDRIHPRIEEVFAKLGEVMIMIKKAGYFPDLFCVLHDVDEEQKEKMLISHSEKLALAFGLMESGEGKPLRVIKNLRICVDCHNFAKFVSKVYGREVSMRDKNRFHQISGGICSCGDYW